VKTLAKQMIHNRWRTQDMRVRVQQQQSVVFTRRLHNIMNLDLNKAQEQELKTALEDVPVTSLLMQLVVPASNTTMRGTTISTPLPVAVLVTHHNRFAAFSKFAHIRADFVGGKQKWSVCCKTKTGYFCLDCGINVPICRRETCRKIHQNTPSYCFRGKRKHAVAFA
jgi:hypothetical protein